MEVKRTILALALSFAILVGWQQLFPPAERAPQNEGAVTEQAGGSTATAQSTPEATRFAQATGGAANIAPAPMAATTAVAEQKSVLVSDKATFTLTNWGGRVESVELSGYNDVAGPDGKPLVLLSGAQEMIGATALEGTGLTPLTPFAVTASGASSVSYTWTSPTGMTVEKVFTLKDDGYSLGVAVKVINATPGPMLGRLGLSLTKSFVISNDTKYLFQGPSYYKEGSLEQVDIDDAVEVGASAMGNISWAGEVEKYFAAVMLPENTAESGVRISGAGQDNAVNVSLMSPTLDLAPGTAGEFKARIFIGPKTKEAVMAVGRNLDQAIEYGWFSAIAKPMLSALDFLYGIFGNYGIAIIILTTLIKLVFWPLSAKSYKSMARMKELQPKLQKLKEKYADDKERLNQETMQLWKTHKVNPMGGCLPIFVQIPVFIALYRALMSSIELRHAPFAFWLVDLSEKDPYYITPILMGASMFLQQKLMPSSGVSEGQMKFMMYGMPFVFTWMFLDFPSGLVIYWLWNNVLSISQQAYMMKAKKAA